LGIIPIHFLVLFLDKEPIDTVQNPMFIIIALSDTSLQILIHNRIRRILEYKQWAERQILANTLNLTNAAQLVANNGIIIKTLLFSIYSC
jgi:hypothetical protein